MLVLTPTNNSPTCVKTITFLRTRLSSILRYTDPQPALVGVPVVLVPMTMILTCWKSATANIERR